MGKKLRVVSQPITSLKEPWCNAAAGTAHDVADIESFLKGTLASKAGCFHYDTANNRYLVFADAEARDTYLENPQDNGSLLLAFFDAPMNYSAEIMLESEQFNAILSGTAGNVLAFTFDTKNKSGQSVGEDVVCTYTFVRGSVRKTVTQKYRAGAKVRMNIDEYIETGTNSITIGIVGQNTLAATTVGVTYQVIDLKLTDEFDLSRVHDLSTTNQIEVPYSISGYGAKTMEWYLDGEQLPFVRNEDEITEAATSRTKYIAIDGLTQGAHHVQLRAYTLINGEKFYSQTLYREFIVYTRADKNPITAIGVDLPLGVPIVTAEEPLKLRGAAQYLPYILKLGLFNPTYATSTPLEIYLDDTLLTTLSMQNDKMVEYELAVTTYGEKTLKLKTEGTERTLPMEIEKSSTSIEEITQGVSLALSATGKSNASSDRSVWKYGAYSTLFNGFKWLANSGWNNGELVISGGAGININCAPLGTDATAGGKTIEMEFSTRNVTDIDAVICDLRNANGTGLLITASEASLTSQGGARVSTRYKAGENVRLAFVINKKSGTADKGLVMLYVNGILSGAANYATNDNFISNKTISIASGDGTDIAIRHIRIYDTALTGNQVLNNFILYRGSAEELLKAYNRNNIYEEGTSDFSTDILSGQLPIMIITGDIPALEATTDKNMQIDVDVEYINLQDRTRSFTLKNGAMRPQGTSSMSYPKKNFRLYTRKKDTTVLLDADGNKVDNRLYAFKAGAQPVDCWCFKADYAESSGTHNTGIARLWNDAMKNAQIGGEYKCRTQAQQRAADSGYPYDVRTTIDGFPILMFYRLTENDPLVFIGKYNFNNDKSTESVFGFRDIPGFNASKVECWEVLNNGHHLALFQDTANWAKEWSDAFEARYPDGATNTTALKGFADWVTSVSAANFAAQKWAHMDVYKMAAYYVYLMRFGAVDQVVKNAMFTTEDGVHWYYINYDNDTINGLRNDGLLIYPPTIDRQTPDPTMEGVYAYAGHDSTLWNMLEADAEFMQIVSEVDSALYSAGLSYANVIKIFDTEQSGKWCERIYNQDAQYKYVGPFNDKGINNLFMLQGSRQSHRRWWLSERFSLLDAKFVSGEYKANSFEVKLAGAPIGLEFSIQAGVATNYGYGVNNVPIQYGISLAKGAGHTFTTTSVLNVGDPLRIYAAPYLEAIDVSNFAPYMTQIAIANVFSDRLGSKLKSLIIGKTGSENTALQELSGINQAEALENLVITGYKGLKNLDLTGNTQLKYLIATNSGLTSLILPTGAPTTTLMLPASLQALTLNGLFYLENSGLTIQNNGCNLTTIDIKDCPSLNTKTLVENWIEYKTAEDSMCSLTLNGLDWDGVDADWLISRLGSLRELSLKGTIEVTSATEEQLTALQQIFGKNCFSPTSELYIKMPSSAGIYFIGPDSVRALSSAQFEMVIAAAVPGESSFSIEGNVPSGVTFVDGYLTVGDIADEVNITLIGRFIPDEGLASVKRKTVTLVPINYPKNNTIEGAGDITKKGVFFYPLVLSDYDEDAQFYIEWEISGAAVTNNLVSLGTTSNEGANVIVSQRDESTFTLKAKVFRKSNNTLVSTASKLLTIFVGDIAITKISNPVIMQKCYQAGWAASPNYMTVAEASAVTDVGDVFNSVSGSNITFNEFQYFINVSVPSNRFSNAITEITIPFTELANMNILSNVKVLHCPNLEKITGGGTCGNLEVLDAPVLNFIGKENYGAKFNEAFIITINKVTELSLPSLKKLEGVRIYADKCSKLIIPLIEDIIGSFIVAPLQEVEGLDNVVNVEGRAVFSASYTDTIEDLIMSNLESLKGLKGSGGNTTTSNLLGSNLKTFSAPKLKCFEEDNFQRCTALESVNLPVLSQIVQSDNENSLHKRGAFKGCSAIKSISLPSLEKVVNADNMFGDCSSLTSVSLPALKEITFTSTYGKSMLNGCTNLEELSLPSYTGTITANFCGPAIKNLRFNCADGVYLALEALKDSNVELIEGYFLKISLSAFRGVKKLHTIRMLASTEPTLDNYPLTDVGIEVPDGVQKTIHIRVDATGFGEDSLWVTKFAVPFGFTIVRDIPAPEN